MAEKEQRRKGVGSTFRVVAAVYILYLAYGLIKDFEQVPAGQRIFIGVTIVVFIAAPVWILWMVYKESKLQKAADAEERAREAEALPEPEEEDSLEADEERLLEESEDFEKG